MKAKLCIIIPVLLFCNAHILFAHKEWVHQYLVQQAYQFLRNEVGDIQELEDHIGTYFGEGSNVARPWEIPQSIAAGVWREDYVDPIWNYGGWFGGGWAPSSTHFWNSDCVGNGGDFTCHTYVDLAGYFETAWEKARLYLLGREQSDNFRFMMEGTYVVDGLYVSTDYNQTIVRTKLLANRLIRSYSSLVDLYTTGNIRDIGVVAYNDFPSTQLRFWYLSPYQTHTLNATDRKLITYHLLGRLCHLLEDMSVPAHTHEDIHPCGLGDGDKHELWMGSNETGDCNQEHTEFHAQSYTAATARVQGGLLWEVFSMSDRDALKYLFYTLNQCTQHFPSKSVTNRIHDGNNSTPHWLVPFVSYHLNQLGSVPADNNDGAVAGESFNLAIRATATLLYWFSVKSGLSSCPTNIYLQKDRLFELPSPGAVEYVEASSRIYAGANVLPSSPGETHGEYVVTAGSRAVFRAGTEVVMKDGFIAEAGCTFIAQIADPPCQTIHSMAKPDVPHQTPAKTSAPAAMQTDTASIIYIALWDSASFTGSADSVLTITPWQAIGSTRASVTSTDTMLAQNPADTIRIVDQAETSVADSIVILRYSNDSTLKTIVRLSSLTVDGASLIIHNLTGSDSGASKPALTLQNRYTLTCVPNPFSHKARIEYAIPVASAVDITLSDMYGQAIMKLVDKRQAAPGLYSTTLDAREVPIGTYYITLRAGQALKTRRVTIVR